MCLVPHSVGFPPDIPQLVKNYHLGHHLDNLSSRELLLLVEDIHFHPQANNGHHLNMEDRRGSQSPQIEDHPLAGCLPELNDPLQEICVSHYRNQE
jgi:hypothetical protein